MSATSLHQQAPGYRYSVREKIQLAGICLAQRLSRRSVLFAGPFAGEFGYELMQWQGYIRARKSHYAETHVLTYPGRDYLYEGCIVHHHDIELQKAGYGYGKLGREAALKVATLWARNIGLRDYDVFDPSLLCTQYHKRLFWRQDFRRFEEEPLFPQQRDFAFHFRAVQKEGPDQMKNYAPERCEKLVKLCLDAGYRILCIGHPQYSICPSGADDCRSVDMKQTIAAISSSRVVLGENSGPMHLANLCGKPTIIWAQDQWRLDFSLRWNPFRVPIYCAINNSCQPEPGILFEEIEKAYKDLRLRTQNFMKPSWVLNAESISPY